MNFNFELILFYATVVTGIIYLFDVIFFAPKRTNPENVPALIDYARSFFPILLIVFLLRSFLFEPFRIPSPSLVPTLLPGDFILVNKYQYGIRLPILHHNVIGVSLPKRGDIMVFRWPADPSVNFIKRVIGLPGDHISYINKELTINGQKIPQTFLQNVSTKDENGESRADDKLEDLQGLKHHIYLVPDRSSRDFKDIIVPDGMYFMLGDNRDASADSRYWGFVPEKNIVGKAMLIWMSWDGEVNHIRFNRLFNMIH